MSRARRIRKGIEADVVRIREGGLLARNRTHAHALVDIEAAGFDDSLLEAPALRTGVLKVQIRVVDAVLGQRAEYRRELARVEIIGRKQ